MSVWEPSSSERTMRTEQVVIGEAVALEVAPASVGLRLASAAIDYTLYVGGLFMTLITWGVLIADNAPNAAVVNTTAALILALWVIVIPVTVETLSRGRSAGRLVTGCRVVRDDGGSIRLRHSLVRVLVAGVEVWLTAGVPAIISCAATRRGKRLGDLLAGTYTVCERGGSMALPPLLMPPELAEWASQADLRGLPGPLALNARTFLQRASTMDPAARARLGHELAESVRPLVYPLPPEGTHPERFLAAVLCERRDRELELARRDALMEQQVAAVARARPYEM